MKIYQSIDKSFGGKYVVNYSAASSKGSYICILLKPKIDKLMSSYHPINYRIKMSLWIHHLLYLLIYMEWS